MHPRPPGRLADCFGVVSIVFSTFDVGFDVLGRDKTHRVAERGQFASPIVRASTCFQSDDGGSEFPEEGDHLCATKVGTQNGPFLLIDAV
jgi:hypothetical protein